MRQRLNMLFEYIPVLLAFLMPFGSMLFEGLHLSALILLWLLVSFFCIDADRFVTGLKNRWFLLLVAFFALHLISALFSGNRVEAVRSVEVKLSFLAFPYFMFLFGYRELTFKKILTAFVSGCLFSLLIMLSRAVYFYLAKGLNYFYYTDFSYGLHASYFSMYLLFAWVLLQLVYPQWFGGDKYIAWLRYAMSLLFIVGIFLCASKIGVIAFFVVQLAVILIRYKSRLNVKKVIALLLGLVALGFVAYKVFPEPFERLAYSYQTAKQGHIDKTSSESTAVRMLIWSECAKVVKEHPLLGVTAGDANDELYRRYQEDGLTGALDKHLNAHNQYFQTAIGLGSIGLLMLLLITAGAMVYGFRKRNGVLALLALIICLNFLVESMLQRQEGVLFTCYFLCVLLVYNPENGNEASPKMGKIS